MSIYFCKPIADDTEDWCVFKSGASGPILMGRAKDKETAQAFWRALETDQAGNGFQAAAQLLEQRVQAMELLSRRVCDLEGRVTSLGEAMGKMIERMNDAEAVADLGGLGGRVATLESFRTYIGAQLEDVKVNLSGLRGSCDGLRDNLQAMRSAGAKKEEASSTSSLIQRMDILTDAGTAQAKEIHQLKEQVNGHSDGTAMRIAVLENVVKSQEALLSSLLAKVMTADDNMHEVAWPGSEITPRDPEASNPPHGPLYGNNRYRVEKDGGGWVLVYLGGAHSASSDHRHHYIYHFSCPRKAEKARDLLNAALEAATQEDKT